jgi:hypothetical protein
VERAAVIVASQKTLPAALALVGLFCTSGAVGAAPRPHLKHPQLGCSIGGLLHEAGGSSCSSMASLQQLQHCVAVHGYAGPSRFLAGNSGSC